MGLSLEEWINKYSSAKFLEKNFKVTLDVMTDLSKEEQTELLRMLMIFARQFGNDCGLE